MNWLYPRTALDMLFPGFLWYAGLWIVLCCVAVCVVVWDAGVWIYRAVRWLVG